MNIKCPKCRFRFDVPAASGIKELQCNCPRCGTPFTYAISEVDDIIDTRSQSEETIDETEILVDKDKIEAPESPLNSSRQETMPPPPPHLDIPVGESFSRPETVFGPAEPPFIRSEQKGKGCAKGCLKKILIGGGCLAALIFFLTRQCESSHSYTADSLEVVSPTDSESREAEVTTPDPTFDESAAEEQAPAWIQGNWHVDTDYGGISLKIYGDRIVETSGSGGGNTSYGRFRYQNHRLYCDFGDHEIFVYRLDMNAEQIDAGNGLLMKKTE